jgi:hypothetical protein
MGFIVGVMKEEPNGKEIKTGWSACGSRAHQEEGQGKRGAAASGSFS